MKYIYLIFKISGDTFYFLYILYKVGYRPHKYRSHQYKLDEDNQVYFNQVYLL